ncbi:MAG: patatin-like phospholipase family protein [Candidatus Paceibacterota bacterium]|jgi:NTE family protein
MIFQKNKKIGLVLGSGSARGFVHIGIIKALERNNIPIDYIAGTSMGAFIGGLYAATKDIASIEKLALDTDWKQMLMLLDPSFGNGFIAGDKIKEFIRVSLHGVGFSNLKIPFSAVATDIIAGEPFVFRDGDLAEAIRASISIPFVFQPVSFKGKMLCDGDLSMPVPVSEAIRMGAEYTIAVDLDSGYFKQKRRKRKDGSGPNFMDMGNSVVMLLSSHLAGENAKVADLVLTPMVGDVEWNSFGSRDITANLIARGEKIMEEAIPRYFESVQPQTFGKRLKDFFNRPL